MAKEKNETFEKYSDTLVTLVMVVENNEGTVEEALQEVSKVLADNYRYYELLIIDNGSTDRSVETIKTLQQHLPNIRLLVLSRTTHLEIAYSAALDNSLGDYVVLMDINYDPPKLIPKLVSKAVEGNDIVVATRKNRKDDPILERFLARIFYSVASRVLGFNFSTNASYFRVLSRRVVNSVIKIRSKNRYLKYFSALIGFKHTFITYKRVYRDKTKRQKRSFIKSVEFALDVIISNSSMPLRFAALVGAIASFVNLLFLGYVFAISLIKKQITEGWITTSVMSATMFFLVFVILTIMSEYIARILTEAKDQPLYFISEEHNSTVLAPGRDRKNVV